MKKPVSPNSIPQNSFILFKNDVFKPLQDIFIFSFFNLSEKITSVHKFANLVSVCKKYSRLDHEKFRSLFLFGGWAK